MTPSRWVMRKGYRNHKSTFHLLQQVILDYIKLT